MPLRLFFFLIFWFCLFTDAAFSQNTNAYCSLDVLSYKVNLEPDLESKSIQGNVIIRFVTDSKDKEVVFNSGNLRVTKVTGESVLAYRQQDSKLIISLIKRNVKENQVQIFYSGKPVRGLEFLNEAQAYTAYFTSEWMVCNDSPGDRAKFEIDLLLPLDKECIASGTLITKKKTGEKMLYSWAQNYETPAYTYGFVIGSFYHLKKKHDDIDLDYYAKSYNEWQLETIFSATSDMIEFFEERSGVPYPQKSYSQILIGEHYQEMSGLSVLKDSYGQLVLKDSTETNLISHELAHQWWGNRITCESWSHIWLNEGIATFMSAAYNEHRFGLKKYTTDIDSYFKVYQSIKENGKDKPLMFTNWLNPTKEDRNLVYFKGAYVLHLLRAEMGEENFWAGLKLFSQTYSGKAVNTADFRKTMEGAAGRSLNDFFKKWIMP